MNFKFTIQHLTILTAIINATNHAKSDKALASGLSGYAQSADAAPFFAELQGVNAIDETGAVTAYGYKLYATATNPDSDFLAMSKAKLGSALAMLSSATKAIVGHGELDGKNGKTIPAWRGFWENQDGNLQGLTKGKSNLQEDITFMVSVFAFMLDRGGVDVHAAIDAFKAKELAAEAAAAQTAALEVPEVEVVSTEEAIAPVEETIKKGKKTQVA